MFDFSKWFPGSTPSADSQNIKKPVYPQGPEKADPQEPSFTRMEREASKDETQANQPNKAKPILEEPTETFSSEQLDALVKSAQSKFIAVLSPPHETFEPKVTNGIQAETPHFNQPHDRLLRQMQLLILLEKIANERAHTCAEYEKFLQTIKTQKILQLTDEQLALKESEEKRIALSKTANTVAWAVPVIQLLVGVGTANPTVIIGGLLMYGLMSLNQTGTMDNKIAVFVKSLESAGMSKEAAQAFVPVCFTVAMVAMSYGFGVRAAIAGGLGPIDQIIIQAGNVASMVATVGQGTAQIAATTYRYEVGMKEAKLTALEGQAADIDFHIERIAIMVKEVLASSNQISKLGAVHLKEEFSMLAGTYGSIV